MLALRQHTDAVDARLDDDVSNIAEDYQRVNRCGVSTAELVKFPVSNFSAAFRADVGWVHQRLQGAHRARLGGSGRIDPAYFARVHS